MAILEYNWRLSDEQAVSGNRASTNVIDIQHLRDIGEGTPIYAHFQIADGNFTGVGSLQIEVVMSDSATLASGRFRLAATPELSADQVTQYSQFFLPVGFFRRGEDNTIYAFDGTPTSTANSLAYIGAYYTNSLGAGKITARLTLDTSTTPRIYPASTSS